MIMGGWKPSSWKLNRGIRRVDGEGEKEHEKLQEQALSDIYHLHMVISQVVKDLKRKCDGGGGGGGDPCLEPLNIFNHMWKYRGEGNANVVVALQNVSVLPDTLHSFHFTFIIGAFLANIWYFK